MGVFTRLHNACFTYGQWKSWWTDILTCIDTCRICILYIHSHIDIYARTRTNTVAQQVRKRICMYIYIYIYIHTHTVADAEHTYMWCLCAHARYHAGAYVHLHAHTHAHTHTHTHTRLYCCERGMSCHHTMLYTRVFLWHLHWECMYVYGCIYIYIHTCIHTYIHTYIHILFIQPCKTRVLASQLRVCRYMHTYVHAQLCNRACTCINIHLHSASAYI